MLNTLTVESAIYDGSDHSVLLALECEEGEARPFGDALAEHEDGNGGETVNAHERGKAKKRQVRQVVRY